MRAQFVQAELTSWNAYLPEKNRREKFQKMQSSPHYFFRGTNHLFWADLAGDRRVGTFSSAKTRTWLQGDLHAYNFGAYTNSKGEVIYSVNDFDEFIFADYQFDLWRMAASLVLIARENGFRSREQAKFVRRFASAYLKTMQHYAGIENGHKHIFTARNTRNPLKKFLKKEGKKNSRKDMLDKWTKRDRGGRRFDLSLEKLAPASPEEKEAIHAGFEGYLASLAVPARPAGGPPPRIVDIARRLLAGTGSMGSPRFYLLVTGETEDPVHFRILDVKRQYRPTAYTYLGAGDRAHYDSSFTHDAEAHAAAYRALTHFTDPFLGWIKLPDGYYSVRERSYVKEGFPADTLTKAKPFKKMAAQWGEILATVHARADKDFDPEITPYSLEVEICRTVSDRREFKKLVQEIALPYADQVESDWHIFLSWAGLS